MGRYSEPLARHFAELAGVVAGDRVLDVGCGPGALSAVLADQVGADLVSAIDPSESFVTATRERLPGVEVRQGTAEALPYDDDSFDIVLAQLVVSFMADPIAGLVEMGRVTRPGGRIAACVWDLAGDRGPLSLFWRAARDIDPDAPSESGRAGGREGHLVELLAQAGLRDPQPATLSVRRSYPSVEDWWSPYTLGVGPAGAYVAALDPDQRDRLLERCQELLPAAPFTAEATAWAAVGHV